MYQRRFSINLREAGISVNILPDAEEIAKIANRIIDTVIKAKGATRLLSQGQSLKSIIGSMTPQQAYQTYTALYGTKIPRYMQGDSRDLGKSLKEAMLQCLKEDS